MMNDVLNKLKPTIRHQRDADSHSAFTWSKSTMETPEKLCEIYPKFTIKTPERHQFEYNFVTYLLTLNIFHTLFWWLHC